MTKSTLPIAVTSRSFSRHPVLRSELLERYSNVRFNEDGRALAGPELIDFARGRRKLITALETFDEEVLRALPELEVISKYGVGTDMLDKEALIRRGIRLGWTGGVNRRSVAELALAFMIALLHLVPELDRAIRAGEWGGRVGRCLTGRTVGIIGCGHIGKDVAVLLKAFDCRILAHDIREFPEFYESHGVTPVGLGDLLAHSDVATLHVPLDDRTKNILDADRLASMKHGAVLVNTARGGLVDEQALRGALVEGRLAGAGFDVFATEPPQDRELLRLPSFLSTPHVGGSSEEAILAMGRAAIAGLDRNAVPSAEHPPEYT